MLYETLSRKKNSDRKLSWEGCTAIQLVPVDTIQSVVCPAAGLTAEVRRSPAFPVVELDRGIIVALLAAGRGFCSGLTRLASDMLQEEAPRQLAGHAGQIQEESSGSRW